MKREYSYITGSKTGAGRRIELPKFFSGKQKNGLPA